MHVVTVIEICSPKVRMGWQKKKSAGLDSWTTCSEPKLYSYLGMLFLTKLSNDPDFFGIAPILLDEAYMRYRSSSSSSGFWVCQNIEEYIPELVIGSDGPPKPMKN